MTETPLVSIILVSYNTRELLRDCLHSVREKTADLPYEIIIVDNQSADGTPSMLREEFPHIQLIEAGANLGFGRANNLGAEQARGKYLFFLNTDTILLNNAVKILVDFMENHPRAGICGANLYTHDMREGHSFFPLPTVANEIKAQFPFIITKNSLFYTTFNRTGKPLEVDCILGADLMIRRDVFEQVGGFDPDFFLYYEETEMTYRVRKAGYKVYSVPDAEIIHLCGMSTDSPFGEKNLWSNREMAYSKFLYFHKISGRAGVRYLNLLQTIKCKSGELFYRIKNKPEKIARWRSLYPIQQHGYRRYLQEFLPSQKKRR